MKPTIKTINLYDDEDGIAIYLSADYDVCRRDEAAVKVIGHRLYCSSAEEANESIRTAYLKRIGIDTSSLTL